MTKEPHSSPKHYKPNAIQQVLEGQEYRFAGDIKRQRVQQAWGKLLHRLNRLPKCVPSLFHGIAQNKAQASSPKGGRREGKILYIFFFISVLSTNLAEQQNPSEL